MENISYQNDKPLVSVICIAYGQEKFIAQALESFVSQKTNFKFQVLVGEDNGPDGTADIILEYAEKYPDIIIPYIRKKNMGPQKNLIDLCKKANTPYIAFCEGDDFWIDEYKLQKQFDYMEAHPEYRACFHNAEIRIDTKDGKWFLSDYFKQNKGKQMIWPEGEKNFVVKKSYTIEPYILNGFVHTSTMFFRWDENVVIPDWYYTHGLGDYTLWILQVGTGKFGFLRDVMSVYRRHETGAYYYKDNDLYMLDTRRDWITIEEDLREYFEKYHNGYCKEIFVKRRNREAYNYFNILLKYNDYETFMQSISDFSPWSYDVLKWTFGRQFQYQALTANLPDVNYWNRNDENRNEYKELTQQRIEKEKKVAFKKYWRNTFYPKKKNIWVFTAFHGRGYLDNTKYLFEYICEHHPEIEAYWFTNDNEVVERLTEEGKNVLKFNTPESEKILRKASVAFVDHWKNTDWKRKRGFNYRIKVVQLWHGVGLKTMDNLALSKVKGVRYSKDIIIKKSDSLKTKIKKRIKLYHKAPYRELCERHFMMVCPGEEMVKVYKRGFHLSEDRFFVCGYPRVAKLFSNESESKNKILYAPTWRWDSEREKAMVENFVASVPALNDLLKETDTEFVIRLHPYTWRNYKTLIQDGIEGYSLFTIDTTEDIYENLADYDMLISDYSSIVYDYLLLDRPLIFMCPDLEEYIASENNLTYDYDEYSPGIKAKSWEAVAEAIKEYRSNKNLYSKEREKVREFFYDMSVNDENNSERIVQEVKRRLEF